MPTGQQHTDTGLTATRAVVHALFGAPAERAFDVRYWDGSTEKSGRAGAVPFTLVISRRGALRRMLLPPNELSIVDAYISGDLDVEGSLESAVTLGDEVGRRIRDRRTLARLARKVLALPADDNPDVAKTRFQRVAGSLARRRRSDAQAIEFHYGVSNEFYELWLDPMMLYTCAYFRTGEESIELAQLDKLEHICRKLRLKRGERLLDIGCGWGGLVRYAAKTYGVEALGITLSESQAAWGRERIRMEGLSGLCKIEVRDYRDLPASYTFDKITSVGVTEHVPADEQPAYFARANSLLRPGGVFLNHCEVSVDQARGERITSKIAAKLWKRGEFIQRYVFPDARLVPAAHVLASAEQSGFEVRDVESLREHYTLTLRHWIRELEKNRAAAIELVGERTYRVWRLYMSAGAHRFHAAKINIIQTLLSKPRENGISELPWTREDIYAAPYPSELRKNLELRTSA